ncbi:MAG: C4-dicarboxylate ABC transporter [Burkholderiaceae bacterium]|nr:C4-dicarboxylate ABC transporter [Burkholderiaceae bacterium]
MRTQTPLQYLAPGWFSVVMGLAGLALAWQASVPVLGESSTGVALVVGALAAVALVVLLVLSVWRAVRHPKALDEDLRHPVRHAFVAALPVALLLVVALAAGLGVQGLWLDGMWWLGALGQLWATVWVLKRWLVATPVPAPAPVASPSAAVANLQGLIQSAMVSPAPASPLVAKPAPGMPSFWPSVTPVLFIPVVGNVVAPMAGLALGYPVWSAAQLGMGLLLWPVVLGLLLVRRAVQGPLPDRLLPTWFITVAPPSVIGLVALVLQAPLPVVAGLWGMALFFLLWAGSIAQQAVNQPFSLTFWAVSFPLAAFTSLTFKLGVLAASAGLQQAGTLLLALTSLVVFGLCLATVRGLREGSLLAPEPVAAIVPVSA